MSKVVHLSDQAHQDAKAFCKINGLRMSDWVAGLIADAIARNHTDVQRAPVAQKKPLKRLEESPKPQAQAPVSQASQPSDEQVPAYALPPFWARNG